MLIGVWNSQDSAMIRNVTRSAWGSPGSESTARQLVRPDGWMVPMPSQVVKLSSSTPTSGMTPKTTKNTSAGTASHLERPLPPPLARRWAAARTAESAAQPKSLTVTAFRLVANCWG